MPKKIVIFGAGVSTIGLIKELESNKEFHITLVDPKDYEEVPFSMLRSYFDNKGLGQISRQKISETFKNVTHIQSVLKTMKEHSAVLGNGDEIFFDYAVIGTGGSTRGYSELRPATTSLTLQDRNILWEKRGKEMKEAKSIIIAGGGVIGVELAGEILEENQNVKLSILSGSDRLLAHRPAKIGKKALNVLKKLGKNVEVYFNDRVEYKDGMNSFSLKEISTKSGKKYSADIIILALGNEFNTDFMKEHFSNLLTDKGTIKVNAHLHLEGYEHIFAIGDVSSQNPVGLGHIAIEHGQIVARSLKAILNNTPLKSFVLGKKDQLEFITLGHNAGIAITPIGRLDFLIKVKTKANFFVKKILATGKAR